MPEVSQLRQRLADELRGARSLAGLSQEAMADRVGISQRMVSRIEKAERLPDRMMLGRWLQDADDDTQSRIQVLVDAAHVETRPWANLREGGHLQGVAKADEEVATRARVYCTSFVPGLLQTAEYARLLAPLVDPGSDPSATVAGRMQRQQRLYDNDRRFEFLVAEPALWWSPSAAVMPAQVDRIVSLATLANVEMGVLPAHRSGPVGWHDFIVWTAPDLPSWVTVEMRHGGAVVADPAAVLDYEQLWSRLWDAAVSGDEAVELIRRTA